LSLRVYFGIWLRNLETFASKVGNGSGLRLGRRLVAFDSEAAKSSEYLQHRIKVHWLDHVKIDAGVQAVLAIYVSAEASDGDQ
jgi:hypothetical protein